MDFSITKLPVQVIKQGALYIAYSHMLDISTTGKSEKQAMETFGALVQIFIQELIKKGTLDHALAEKGWTKRNKH